MFAVGTSRAPARVAAVRSSKGLARGSIARTTRQRAHARASRSGAALVEFAFVALAFYLLLAGTIEVGRMVFSLQALQNAARVGAREFAQIELPATYTFEQALRDPQVRERVFDPGLLVLDVSSLDDAAFQQRIDNFPTLNRMLVPLMIRERLDIGAGEREYFHYPGAILRVQNPGPFDPPYTVGIPRVLSQDDTGAERIDWLPVVEEIRPSTDPNEAPFSMVSSGRHRGLVCLRINYPFQAATLSSYRTDDSSGVVVNTAMEANDGGVVDTTGPLPGTSLANATGGVSTYAGPYGLGRQFALNKEVRPYRRILSGQSMFRREVFSR